MRRRIASPEMSNVLLLDPMLGEGAWTWLRSDLDQGISTSVFEPEPVHTYDQEVEAAALYRQMERIQRSDIDLAVAVGGACGPAAHVFADGSWLPGARLVLLEPDVRPLVRRLPEVRHLLAANVGPSTASAVGRLALATVKQLPQFLSGRPAEATEKVFQGLASNDKQRQWASMMATATRKKEPIDPDLHDSSGLGARVLDWYGPWVESHRQVEVWFRRSTGLARFAEQQSDPRGRYRLIDAPSAAWINAPELLAALIKTALIEH
jgi:hypothetical protein